MIWYVNPGKPPKRRASATMHGVRVNPKRKAGKASARRSVSVTRKGKKLYGAAALAVLSKRKARKPLKKVATRKPAKKKLSAAQEKAKIIKAVNARFRKMKKARASSEHASLYINPHKKGTTAMSRRRRRPRRNPLTAVKRKKHRRVRLNPVRRVKRRRMRRNPGTSKRAGKAMEAARAAMIASSKPKKKRSKRKGTKAVARRRSAARRTYSPKRKRAIASYRRLTKRHYRKPPHYRGRGPKRKSRGYKSLVRARRAIKYQRAHGGGAAKKFLSQFRMRSNPGGIVGVLKMAAPIAAAFYGSRFLASFVSSKVPMISEKLGQKHASPVVAALLAVVGHVVTKHNKAPAMLRNHRGAIMTGLGINLIDQVVKAYAPENIKGYIGVGDASHVYDRALSEYVDTGEYIETGDYISTGMEQELGLEQDLGLSQELGMTQGAMRGPVPVQRMLAPVPHRSFTQMVPSFNDDMESDSSLYAGVFAGSRL